MTGPSDKAVEAALNAPDLRYEFADEVTDYPTNRRVLVSADDEREDVRRMLVAAYPVIRADVIAEVVEALRTKHREWPGDDVDPTRWSETADFMEREFGRSEP